MNEHVFYTPGLNDQSVQIALDQEESHHLAKVLRLKENSFVHLLNGNGLIALAKISGMSGKQVDLEIEEIKSVIQPRPFLHLAVCLLKKREKMEWIIEKASELEVTEISFILSDHSERSKMNMERFQKVLVSAAKQAFNPFIPVLNDMMKLDSFLKKNENSPSAKFIALCETDADQHLAKYLRKDSDAIILLGPEGDFSEREIKAATGRDFVPVSLGSLRLRSETAAIHAVSVFKAINSL